MVTPALFGEKAGPKSRKNPDHQINPLTTSSVLDLSVLDLSKVQAVTWVEHQRSGRSWNVSTGSRRTL